MSTVNRLVSSLPEKGLPHDLVRTLAVMIGHTRGVIGAKVLSDSRLLSRSEDGALLLWDGNSGKLLAVLEGRRRLVRGVKDYPMVEYCRGLTIAPCAYGIVQGVNP